MTADGWAALLQLFFIPMMVIGLRNVAELVVR
jgi:hypothetical protein